MKDRDFLIWIHARLENYGDDPLMDFMHKLRAVITSIPEDQETPSDGRGGNNIDQMLEKLHGREAAG